MNGNDFLREQLRLALRFGTAFTALALAGAALSLSGAPDLVSWPAAAGAATAGWWGGDRLMRRYEERH